MSQAAVNRTAMYTISIDTLAGLNHRFAGLQYFGKAFKGLEPQDHQRHFNAGMLQPVLADPDGFAQAEIKRSGEFKNFPRLFLDPLYVLFDELRDTDHVMVLDLSTVTKPEWHSPAVARAYSHAFDKISTIRPKVSAISKNTADTLRVNFGYPPELIGVVPLYVPSARGCQTSKVKTPVGISTKPYVLFVGSLEARKNLVGAVRAFELSGLSQKGYNLVIVGGNGHGAEDIRRYAANVDGVIFSGFLDDSELQATYAGASAFLYPSFLEGFGVPLLEAMAHGVPCVASKTGACPEVGGSYVEYFDPDDSMGFAEAIKQLVSLPPDAREKYRKSTARHISDHYSVEKYLAALDSLIQ